MAQLPIYEVVKWVQTWTGWWAMKISIILSFFLVTHLPASLQKIRRSLIQGLSILIIIHWLLLPYYHTAWESLTYLSKCLLVLQTFLQERDIHVWLAVVILLLWGSLPWVFLLFKTPTNWSNNPWAKRNGTGTEEQLEGVEREIIQNLNIEKNRQLPLLIMSREELQGTIRQIVREESQPVAKEGNINETGVGKVTTNGKEFKGNSQKIDDHNRTHNALCLQLYEMWFEEVLTKLDDIEESIRDRFDEREGVGNPFWKRKEEVKVKFVDELEEKDHRDSELKYKRQNEEVVALTNSEFEVESSKRIKSDKPSPIESTLLTEDQLQALQKETSLEGLQTQLQNIKEEVTKQYKLKQFLTPVEKEMTRAQLERKWAEERHEKRFGPREDIALTEEEREMTKAQLYRKIIQERRDSWASKQREKGLTLTQCEICGRYETTGTPHLCLRAKGRGPLQRRSGVPYHRELVVTGSPSGFSVRNKPIVDQKRLKSEYEKIKKAIEEVMPLDEGENKLETQPKELSPSHSILLEREEQEDQPTGSGMVDVPAKSYQTLNF